MNERSLLCRLATLTAESVNNTISKNVLTQD